MRSLKEFTEQNRLSLRLSDIENESVIIKDVTIADSQYGEYAIMNIERSDKSNASVITSAFYVMEALKRAKDANAYPVTATFKKNGRAWVVA